MKTASATPLAHRVDSASTRLGISRTTLYELLKAGEIRSIKVGARTLIPESVLQRFIADKVQHGDEDTTKAAQLAPVRALAPIAALPPRDEDTSKPECVAQPVPAPTPAPVTSLPPSSLSKSSWRRLYQTAQKNAKTRGIEFSLTWEAFAGLALDSRGCCSITGLPFDQSFDEARDARERRPWAASLDRIDSKAGYIPGNVRLVCYVVNAALGTWGEGPFFRMVEAASKCRNP